MTLLHIFVESYCKATVLHLPNSMYDFQTLNDRKILVCMLVKLTFWLGTWTSTLKSTRSGCCGQNFVLSSQIFKRKKRAWGYVYPQPNGSYVATGMVGDLFFNRADLVVASLTINPERGKYIDYLLPLEPQKIGLYIPMESSKGDFDYDIYFSPFR